jgi:hypothetical protein
MESGPDHHWNHALNLITTQTNGDPLCVHP